MDQPYDYSGFDTVFKDSVTTTDRYQPSVLISGPPGAGKSMIALTLSSRLASQGLATVYVLTEERATDGRSTAKALDLFNGSTVHVDDDYTSELTIDEPGDLESGAALFTFYPELAFDTGETPKPAFATLNMHIQNRVGALRNAGYSVALVVIDSLFADPYSSDDFSFARSDDVDQPISRIFWGRQKKKSILEPEGIPRSFAERRVRFKELCELSSAEGISFLTLIEHEDFDASDFREFVADVVVHVGYDVDDASGVLKRHLQIIKSRYRGVLEGRHYLSLGLGGARVLPNAYSILATPTLESEEYVSKTDTTTPIDAMDMQPFAGGHLHTFLPEIRKGSACLLYGHDQTRKRLVAVRFLEQTPPGEKTLVICVGTDESSYSAALDRYRRTDSDHEFKVELISCPIFASSMGRFLADLYPRIKGTRYSRVVVDDVGAFDAFAECVPPLKLLIGRCGVTSLFVHTLESEEPNTLSVIFDTIVRTRRFTIIGDDRKSFFAYHKSKVNSVSPSDYSWWEIETEEHTFSKVEELKGYFLQGNSLGTAGALRSRK